MAYPDHQRAPSLQSYWLIVQLVLVRYCGCIFNHMTVQCHILIQHSSGDNQFHTRFLNHITFIPCQIMFYLRMIFLYRLPTATHNETISRLIPV